MSRRSLLTPLLLIIVVAFGSLTLAVVSDSSPALGLDLQGGFSVVLQAKEVKGRLPSEESVEKAKDIIRQRVDGLGVSEPEITRQGRTVIVQLPGVKDRAKAESLVGCTARLEFRPVVSVAPNPDAPSAKPSKSTTTTKPKGSKDSTTTTKPDGSTTTTTTGDGSGEGGAGVVGAAPGEGALPAQFAPSTTTTTTTTTAPPETTTTTTAPGATTTTAPGATTTTVPGATTTGSSSSCGGASGADTNTTTTTTPGTPAGGGQFLSDDGQLVYTLGPAGFSGDALSSATASLNTSQWEVLVGVKGSQQDKANAVFNACYQGGETCPAQNQDGRGAIAIVLDGEVLSAPAVNGPDLASDEFTISGDFSQSEAKDLALVLRYGSLPVEFEQAALQQVSATLGKDSLRAGLIAGLIGLAAVAIYMILYYRGLGLVVVAGLSVWGALMYGIICWLSASQGLALSLSGIIGIVVSVGTTVDSYVVYFERLKDEVRAGRSVKGATERGFDAAFRTIVTADVSSFIGASLLWWLTVGPVRGFAFFLGLSVVLDLIVAWMFTRPLVILLGRSPKVTEARFFGLARALDRAPEPAGVPA